MLEFPHFRKAWLVSLQELHNKWGGKLDDGKLADTYATLLVKFRGYRIYLSRDLGRDIPCMEIYVYGKWHTEIILSLENVIDQAHKFLGLENEIVLEGYEVNIVLFNKNTL